MKKGYNTPELDMLRVQTEDILTLSTLSTEQNGTMTSISFLDIINDGGWERS